MKVFIADDSAKVRERLIDVFAGFNEIEFIGMAQDADQAAKSIRKLKPDVVILDIRMPGGSGIDVLENIKENEIAPVTIIYTNYPYPQYRKKCMDAGAEFFFDKSTESEKMIEVLEQLNRDFTRSRVNSPGNKGFNE